MQIKKQITSSIEDIFGVKVKSVKSPQYQVQKTKEIDLENIKQAHIKKLTFLLKMVKKLTLENPFK